MSRVLIRRITCLAAGLVLGYGLSHGVHPGNLGLIAGVVLLVVSVAGLKRNEGTLDGVWPLGFGACAFLATVGLGSLGLPACDELSRSRCAGTGAPILTWVSLGGAFASLGVAAKDRPLLRGLKYRSHRRLT